MMIQQQATVQQLQRQQQKFFFCCCEVSNENYQDGQAGPLCACEGYPFAGMRWLVTIAGVNGRLGADCAGTIALIQSPSGSVANGSYNLAHGMGDSIEFPELVDCAWYYDSVLRSVSIPDQTLTWRDVSIRLELRPIGPTGWTVSVCVLRNSAGRERLFFGGIPTLGYWSNLNSFACYSADFETGDCQRSIELSLLSVDNVNCGEDVSWPATIAAQAIMS